MTETLSPAALAVLDAAARAMECPDGFLPYEQKLIAVALGALVDQLAYADSEGRQFLYAPEVRGIAAELEAHHG